MVGQAVDTTMNDGRTPARYDENFFFGPESQTTAIFFLLLSNVRRRCRSTPVSAAAADTDELPLLEMSVVRREYDSHIAVSLFGHKRDWYAPLRLYARATISQICIILVLYTVNVIAPSFFYRNGTSLVLTMLLIWILGMFNGQYIEKTLKSNTALLNEVVVSDE